MSNLVVIIGRPNVGKSTLFNRLVGKKLSIVHRSAGVTRDRVYGRTSWRGKNYEIVDTGGLISFDDTFYSNKIREQIGQALKEAIAAIFLVDGRTGLHPEDLEIAKLLYKSNIPFVLAANKIDLPKDADRGSEFYPIGKDKVIPISAEHGIGVDDLLDELAKFAGSSETETESDEEMNELRLLILGRPNVGKSTLLNTILNEERAIVDEKPGTTRDLLTVKFEYQGQLISITDSAGLRKKSKVRAPIELFSVLRAINHIDRCDVAILIIDVSEGLTVQDRRIAALVIAKNKGLIVAVNKIDLCRNVSPAKICSLVYQSAPFLKAIPVITLSALKKIGLERLLNKTLDIYQEMHKWVDKITLKNLVKELTLPPGKNRIYDLRQIGSAPPVFLAITKKKLGLDYVRYLKNQLRNYFGFAGNPIIIKTRVVKRT